ncbi:MAG: hypothetical protein RR049_00245, partial [Angelakisella sp.]
MSTQQETPESKLRSVIRDRYHSVRAFCNQYNLPYSTVDNVFKRGVNNVGISTATQLCDLLELDLAAFAKGLLKKRQGAPNRWRTAKKPSCCTATESWTAMARNWWSWLPPRNIAAPQRAPAPI